MRALVETIFTILIFPSYSCKPVSVEQDRYRPFVKLFNDVLGVTENLKFPSLRKPQLEILFHRNDSSDLKGDRDPTSSKCRPDIGTITLSMTKEQSISDNYYLARSDFASTAASFSWLDMLLVVKFKLYDKILASPPQTYNATLHHLVAHTEDVYGKLHTAPTIETSKPSLSKRPPNPPAPRPQKGNIITRMREILGTTLVYFTLYERPLTIPDAENDLEPPRTAAQQSMERNSAILKKELDNKGKTKGSSSTTPAPKKDDPEEDLDKTPPVIQVAAYATELLCRGIYATHAVTLLIAGECTCFLFHLPI